MKSFEYKITDETGLHARPAGQLVKAASAFSSEINLFSGEKSASVCRSKAGRESCLVF